MELDQTEKDQEQEEAKENALQKKRINKVKNNG